ncbi:class IV aminotransferase [Paracoccus sp. S-4012]|uniref:aminotransferase class IV n=1 Tax=Paracoccus sp. S-4012 TaxID=2665648 RepID=UPI0012AF59AF|nr:aminotransferase class IV [Paracoccus sp. S-4012]MRX51811.1 class IV aminotransferase [Paracoccus sp. S-4012]
MAYTDYIFEGYRKRLAELRESTNPFADGIAWTGGDYMPVHEATVPLLDNGFMKSDLAYDVPAVWDGRYFRLDDHIERFERSCAKLRLTCPIPREELRHRLIEMVARSGIRDAYVMMIVTRGLRYLRQYAPEECENRCYLMVTPFLWVIDEELQKTGASAIIARDVRRVPPGAMDPTVKNLQWGDFTRALLEARDRGCSYALLTDGDRNLAEGSGFNVVLVKDGRLFTPARGVLEGVTRKSVLLAADRLGIPWEITDVPVSAAYDCDEMMFVTTAGGVMPVTTLDGEKVGDGSVGPVTQALWKAYWDQHYDPEASFAVSYE